MLRMTTWFIVCAALLITPHMAHAQIGLAWTALIYESNSGTVTHIDYDGAPLREFALPIEPNLSEHGLGIAASPDGGTIAYTLADSASGNVTEARINLYDVASDQIIASYPLADGADINSFNQASLRIRPQREGDAFATAYGYFVNNELTWEVVQLASDQTQTLTLPELEERRLTAPEFSYPLVLDYADNQITFTLIPFEGFQSEYSTYIWNLADDDVVLAAPISLPIQVSLAGTELTLDFDESLPHLSNPPQMGFVEPYNAVRINRRVVYHTDDAILMQAQFVTGNSQIAVYTASEDFQLARRIVDLDGNALHTEPMSNGTPAIVGTSDGFLILDYVSGSNPKIKHVLGIDGSFTEREIWVGAEVASYTIIPLPE